ncbi:MAG: SGNH/GDSL hydrolase family protein [Nitrospinota bacterium]|nr:SGNH/GDSL hydrolase family protein [Nitrospinota bacterium]
MKKNLAFTIAAIALGVLALEGASFLALKIIGPEGSGASQLESPSASAPGAPKPDQLADTIIFNLERNPLTTPDPELIFRVRPNPSGQPVAGYEGINSQGFRGGDLSQPAVAGELKIMIVGDSNGFGWGLPQYENTWATRLRNILAERNVKARIYNISQPGYSSQQAQFLFHRWFGKIEPDFVIFYLGWNDIWSTPGLTDRKTMWMMSAGANPWARAVTATNVYKLLKRAVKPITEYRQRRFAQQAGYGSQEAAIRVPLAESVENIGGMIDQAERKKARSIIILPPYSMATPELYTIEKFNKAIFGTFRQRAAFPMLAPLRGDNPQNWKYFIEDGFHANEDGALIIARELADAVTAYTPGGGQINLDKVRVFPGFASPKETGAQMEDPGSAAGWIRIAQAPGDPPGAMAFGPYIGHDCRSSRALFRMKSGDLSPDPLVTIDAASDKGRKIHASRTIQGGQFGQAGQWREFEIAFSSQEPIDGLELRVQFLGRGSVALDTITLACQ